MPLFEQTPFLDFGALELDFGALERRVLGLSSDGRPAHYAEHIGPEKLSPQEVHNAKWGDNPDMSGDYEHEMAEWLANFIYWNGSDDAKFGCDRYVLTKAVRRFRPAPSEEKRSMVAIWPDEKAYKAGPARRLRLKPGRAFLKIFPWLDNNTVIKLVDEYLKRYGIEPESYTVKTGKAKRDFAHAYSHERSDGANLYTTSYRKSLSCSCMRYDFAHLSDHPTTAYASGDFTMVWVEDPDGRIAARCVVMTREGAPIIAGPIYAVNEVACDVAQNHIQAVMGGTMWQGEDEPWVGARLLRIEEDGGYLAPYLDVHPQILTDDGNYLVISRHGEIDASDYDGILNGCTECYECGCHIHRDDDYMVDGEYYCESCYSDLFVYCEYYGETVRSDSGTTEVMTRPSWGRNRDVEQYWCDDAVAEYAVYCEDDRRYWHAVLALQHANGDYLSPNALDSGDYGICSVTGDIYDIDEMVILDEEMVHESVIDSDLHVQDENTNEWRTRDAA